MIYDYKDLDLLDSLKMRVKRKDGIEDVIKIIDEREIKNSYKYEGIFLKIKNQGLRNIVGTIEAGSMISMK